MRRIHIPILLSCVTVMSACGGAAFHRDAGTHRYRPLKAEADVTVLAENKEPTGRHEILGTLHWTHRNREVADPEMPVGTEKLKTVARRIGCDMITDIAVKTTAKVVQRKTRRNVDGRLTQGSETVQLWTHRFSARCVRTNAAPGGLKGVEMDTPAAPSASAPEQNQTQQTQQTPQTQQTQPEPQDPAKTALWLSLSQYKQSWLSKHAAALSGAAPHSHVVLPVFAELMERITGKRGFWVKRAPKLLRCSAANRDAACRKLKSLRAQELKVWRIYQGLLQKESATTSLRWVKENQNRMVGYLERFVPSGDTSDALKKTGLYRSSLMQ